MSKVLTVLFFLNMTFNSYKYRGLSVLYLNRVVKINLTHFNICFFKKKMTSVILFALIVLCGHVKVTS